MTTITDLETLTTIYGEPAEVARRKVVDHLTPAYRVWIERARFCILSTVGPEGTDGSPRGDDGPVVTIQDDRTLLMPDWHGNNRIDSLRNIVTDGRVSLLFLVAGSNNAMRINGRAILSVDPALLERFKRGGKRPRSVIVVSLHEVYAQCGRAILRSGIWAMGDQSQGLPTVGEIMAEITKGDFDGLGYDSTWTARAAETMW